MELQPVVRRTTREGSQRRFARAVAREGGEARPGQPRAQRRSRRAEEGRGRFRKGSGIESGSRPRQPSSSRRTASLKGSAILLKHLRCARQPCPAKVEEFLGLPAVEAKKLTKASGGNLLAPVGVEDDRLKHRRSGSGSRCSSTSWGRSTVTCIRASSKEPITKRASQSTRSGKTGGPAFLQVPRAKNPARPALEWRLERRRFRRCRQKRGIIPFCAVGAA